MNIFLGYIFLLLAQLGTSGKQFAMKKCGEKAPGIFNSICINMMRSLICLIVSLVIWLISGGETTTLMGHIVIIISGVGMVVNLLTWILSSQIVSLVLIESLSLLGSMVIPMILAPYIYRGETVSLFQWVSCILIILSLFFFMEKDCKEKEKASILKKVITLIACVAGTTVTTILKKYYVVYFTSAGKGSVEYFTFISFVIAIAIFIIMFAVYYLQEASMIVQEDAAAKPVLPYKKVCGYIVIAAVALYVNEIFTVYAQGNLLISVYLPVAKGLTLLCTFGLDVVIFKCKISRQKMMGLIVVLTAIIFSNL